MKFISILSTVLIVGGAAILLKSSPSDDPTDKLSLNVQEEIIHHRRPPSTGIIIIPVPPPEIRVPVKLSAQSFDIQVTDNAARVKVTQTFKNQCGLRLEGMYIFPMPEQSVISDFAMFDGETRLTGRVLDKDEAKKIYEDIVRKQRDPALLEFIGQGMFQARIFPIEPHSEKKLELTYNQLIKAENNSYRVACNILPDRINSEGASVTLNISIKSAGDISNIYSPTHTLTTKMIDSRNAHISIGKDESGKSASRDFVLYYLASDKAISCNVISFRPISDEDGFFLLSIAPKFEQENTQSLPKDIIFVLDRSGSMSGEKIIQAREALKFCLRSLNANDRFGLIDFSDNVNFMKNSLTQVTPPTIDDAMYVVDKITATGGTNINEALQKALAMKTKKDGRGTYIIFLTDGLPTLGEQNPAKILKNIIDANKISARIFSFGVGYDVDTYLLDKISDENGGSSNYVKPNENIEVEVSKFFAKINEPLLTDVNVSYDGTSVSDMYPKKLPDIFKGSQLTIFGRYKNGGKSRVTLSGLIGDSKKSYHYDVSFEEKERQNDFVAGLWARRKVAYLLDEVRLNGENKELIDEIIKLSKQYGIVTQYTSFIITEKEETAMRDRIGGAFDRRSFSSSGGYAPVAPKAAESMVHQSIAMQKMKQADKVEADEVGVQYKSIAGRIFILKDDVWTDQNYDSNKKYDIKEIRFGSDEYFSFVQKNPKYFEILQLGEKVIFVDGKIGFKII